MRVRLHHDADHELISAALWIEQERAGYGDRFLAAFEIARERLGQYHQIGPRAARRVRRKRILGFPYDVIYELLEDEIVILAIAHHARRQGYWRERLDRP